MPTRELAGQAVASAWACVQASGSTAMFGVSDLGSVTSALFRAACSGSN